MITKETLRRAGRTFLQAFISFLLINYATVPLTGDKATIKQAVISLIGSAIASGISAMMNLEKTQQGEIFEEVPEDDITTESEGV